MWDLGWADLHGSENWKDFYVGISVITNWIWQGASLINASFRAKFLTVYQSFPTKSWSSFSVILVKVAVKSEVVSEE